MTDHAELIRALEAALRKRLGPPPRHVRPFRRTALTHANFRRIVKAERVARRKQA